MPSTSSVNVDNQNLYRQDALSWNTSSCFLKIMNIIVTKVHVVEQCIEGFFFGLDLFGDGFVNYCCEMMHLKLRVYCVVEKIDSWEDFDIFTLDKTSKGRTLEMVCMVLLEELQLLDSLKLDRTKMRKFLQVSNFFSCTICISSVSRFNLDLVDSISLYP